MPVKTPGEVQSESILLEKKYSIKPTGKGASQNDILLITYAKIEKKVVVTLEAHQSKTQQMKKHNYKIPLICKDEEVDCIDHIDFLRKLNISI